MIFSDCKRFILLGLFLFNLTANAQIIWLEESTKRLSWDDAQEFCKKNNAILPSKEMFIKVWLENNKASDIKGFNLSVSYWTSTQRDEHSAYPFYFMEGRDTWYYKKDHYAVRCIQNK